MVNWLSSLRGKNPRCDDALVALTVLGRRDVPSHASYPVEAVLEKYSLDSCYLSPFTAKAKVGSTTTMLPPAKLNNANLRPIGTGVGSVE